MTARERQQQLQRPLKDAKETDQTGPSDESVASVFLRDLSSLSLEELFAGVQLRYFKIAFKV
jgi:hypothetical protein